MSIVDVTVEDDPDRRQRRLDLGIQDEAASCHTAVVAGYVLEGHVPLPAIERLLADRAEVAGLTLPGMPSDSPGTGGDESTWATQPVMAVQHDGSLTPFDDRVDRSSDRTCANSTRTPRHQTSAARCRRASMYCSFESVSWCFA